MKTQGQSSKLPVMIGGILLTLLVILGIAFYLFYQSPRYSIYVISQSIDNRDYETFSKYVDIDTVVRTAIDESLEESKDEDESGLVEGFANLLKPAIIDEAKSQFRKQIETGKYDEKAVFNKGPLALFTDISIVKDGKIANVTVKTDKEDFKFKMRNKGSYWQIFEIDTVSLPTEEEAESEEETNEISANIGEEVTLKTISFTIHSSKEVNQIAQEFSDPIKPSVDAKLVVVDVTVKNISKEEVTVDYEWFPLRDTEDRTYSIYDEYFVDGSLYLETIAPGLSKRGTIIYEIPTTATGYSIEMGKVDTNDVYVIKLK